MSDYEIVIKNVPAQKIVSAREVIARPELMRERCIALMNAVESLLKTNNVTPSGPSLAIYHNHSEAGIDTEMALIVPADTPSLQGGQAATRDLPGSTTMAATTYRGSYDDHGAVGNLHQSLARWIEQSGYRPTGPIREIYVQVPGTLGQGASGVMELNWPVEKV